MRQLIACPSRFIDPFECEEPRDKKVLANCGENTKSIRHDMQIVRHVVLLKITVLAFEYQLDAVFFFRSRGHVPSGNKYVKIVILGTMII